eukprot:g44197.t1
MESLMENPMRAVLYLKELTTIVQNQQTLIQTQRHRIHELELKVEELLEENQSLRDQPAISGHHHHHHHHHHQQQQQLQEQEHEQEQEQQRDLQQHHQDPQHKHPAISTRATIPCNPEKFFGLILHTVVKKVFGTLAFIGQNIEYRSWDVMLRLYRTL